MKQVINQKGKISVRDVPPPQCEAREVLVALTHSLISSGTETHTLRVTGQNLLSRAKERPDLVKKVVERARSQGVRAAIDAVREKVNEPKPMGYSATGIVVEVGAHVTRFRPGDRVACGGATACHADLVAVPENLAVLLPAGSQQQHGAFATLGAIAMQGVRRAQPEFGDHFVILGLGLVGQLCVQFAKIAGLRVLGFDLAPDRVNLARELGADEAFALSDVDPFERVAAFTDGVGADAVIVAAATQDSQLINDAVGMARDRGRISVVGMIGMDIQHTPIYMKELDLHLSRSYGPGRYDPQYEEHGIDYPIAYVRWTENRNMREVLRLIHDGRLQVDPLISAEFPIDRADAAYQALQEGERRPLGVILTYPRAENMVARSPESPAAAQRTASRKVGGKIGLAVIGCGGFCKKERLPYLRHLSEIALEMLVSGTGAKVNALAAQYNVRKCGTDYREALADPDVSCLLVAAPNSLHAPITLAAAKAGKDVFVEKPMAVSLEELEQVYAAVKTAGIRYACGFNRRYAPASVALKSFLDGMSGPKNVLYRCNVGLTPPGHMMHPAEEGGGLIVGEACHFFDFCNWLIGAPPVDVTAIRPSYSGTQFVASDNMNAVVKYRDGSTATIVYTTMGNTSLAKERCEIFAGGSAAVLDDFVCLKFHGAKKKDWSGTQDKGHKTLMEQLARDLAAGDDMPIGLEASYMSHLLTFAALESARCGRVVEL